MRFLFRACAAIALLAVAAPSMSAAQSVPAEADAGETTNDAAKLIGEKKPAEAIAMLDRIIAAQTSKYRGETRRTYCAGSPEESLAYMVMAASDRTDAVVIDHQWCMALF